MRERDILSFLLERELKEAIRKKYPEKNITYQEFDQRELFCFEDDNNGDFKIQRDEEQKMIRYLGILEAQIPSEKYLDLLKIANGYNFFNPFKICVIEKLGIWGEFYQEYGKIIPEEKEIKAKIHILVHGIGHVLKTSKQFLEADQNLNAFMQKKSFDLRLY